MESYSFSDDIDMGPRGAYHTSKGKDERFWGNQGAGVLLIARDTGRILLVLRSPDVNEPNTWGILGGAIDNDENPKQAVYREVSEEVGYTGNLNLQPSFVFRSKSFKYHNFIGVVDSEFEPTLDWESSDAGWFPLKRLPKPLHFGVTALMNNARGQIESIIDDTQGNVTESVLRSFIRESLVSAGKSYVAEKEAPKQKFEAELVRIAKESPAATSRVKPGSMEHLEMIENALDSAGITEKSLRDLISRPFVMIPPAFLLKM